MLFLILEKLIARVCLTHSTYVLLWKRRQRVNVSVFVCVHVGLWMYVYLSTWSTLNLLHWQTALLSVWTRAQSPLGTLTALERDCPIVFVFQRKRERNRKSCWVNVSLMCLCGSTAPSHHCSHADCCISLSHCFLSPPTDAFHSLTALHCIASAVAFHSLTAFHCHNIWLHCSTNAFHSLTALHCLICCISLTCLHFTAFHCIHRLAAFHRVALPPMMPFTLSLHFHHLHYCISLSHCISLHIIASTDAFDFLVAFHYLYCCLFLLHSTLSLHLLLRHTAPFTQLTSFQIVN